MTETNNKDAKRPVKDPETTRKRGVLGVLVALVVLIFGLGLAKFLTHSG